MIHYISGGERSGKSSYAQNLVENLSDKPVYLATARCWDDDFKTRIQRHKSERGPQWINIEEEVHLAKVTPTNHVILLDCVTLWLTNLYLDFDNDVQKSLEFAKDEIDKLDAIDSTIYIISNEIGMGVHAQNYMARKFTELQGWVNQYIAKKATTATFMVSGIPLKIKE